MFLFFPLRDEYRVKKFPILVLSLILINILIFFYTTFAPEYEQIIQKYGFIPSSFSLKTAFTSMFLHGGILHLGFNMWYLWLLGDNIEDRWGVIPFLLFYLSAGIFSMLLYSALVTEQSANIPTIGASGAIAGVLGVYAILFPKSRITFKYFIWVFLFIMRFGEFKVYAFVWLTFWFLEQALSTLLTVKEITTSSVAFGAHFAGFLYGAIIGLGTKIYQEAKFKENVKLGENMLFKILGSKQFVQRRMEEYGEIESAKSIIKTNIEENRAFAAQQYGNIVKKYNEVTLPEKIQYNVAESLFNIGEQEAAYLACKNFLLNYPFSKFADKALFTIGKLFIVQKEYEKAKYAFLQVVLFYPYSNMYEESKYFLEKKLPPLFQGTA
ncbi:rhomboid family intramembrane serine protease [bacterium]|nr:rhomboid family intramembrane serine protease [bacterium]